MSSRGGVQQFIDCDTIQFARDLSLILRSLLPKGAPCNFEYNAAGGRMREDLTVLGYIP